MAIRLRGPGFKPRPGQKFETRFLLHSHPSGGEGVSPMQGEAIRRLYIKPEYLSYVKMLAPSFNFSTLDIPGSNPNSIHILHFLFTRHEGHLGLGLAL